MDNKKKIFNKTFLNKTKCKFNYYDILDYNSLLKCIKNFKPNYIFHLAAQSLVIDSYKNPNLTFQTNINGTINLLEICKKLNFKTTILIITSDKCYLNSNNKKIFNEDDKLGGSDPYSSSKACAEIISNSYYESFFKKKKIGLATLRAGNVIGGNDWSKNRIIPDIIRSIYKKKTLVIRNSKHSRPWQFILDVIFGYLILATKVKLRPSFFSGSWNFGPSYSKIYSVKNIVDKINNTYNFKVRSKIKKPDLYEAKSLILNSKKSKKYLNWRAKTSLDKSLTYTMQWYKEYFKKNYSISLQQIKRYFK